MCKERPQPEAERDGLDCRPGQVIRTEDPTSVIFEKAEPDLVIERFAYTPMGTFGMLTMPEFECYTVERPWFDNVPRVSCIPCGIYPLRVSRYNRGGYDTLLIADVSGRSLIKIHRGNTMDDVLGCIALGRKLGFVNGKWAVQRSIDAFQEWWDLMLGQIEGQSNQLCDWEGRIEIYNKPGYPGRRSTPEPGIFETAAAAREA